MNLGAVLFFALPIELLAVIMLSPGMDWADWILAISIMTLTLWAATRLVFHKHIQQLVATAIALLGRGIYKGGHKIYSRVGRKKKLKEMRDSIPEPPKVARKNSELIRIHSKILNRGLVVIPGYDTSKRPISIDLGSSHTLIAGSSGGGKTNILNAMLIQLFGKRKANFQIYIIDLKDDREDGMYKWAAAGAVVIGNDIKGALALLSDLDKQASVRFRHPELKKRPVLLFIDELARLTVGTIDREHRQEAMRSLALLSEKARGAKIHIIAATQYPKYDVLDSRISINFDRRICLPLKTAKQAEVVLGFHPNGGIPRGRGQFILSDGLTTVRGKSLKVTTREIDQIILRRISHFDDDRMELWKEIAHSSRVGDSVMGINKTVQATKLGQGFVQLGYRHLAYAGVLEPPHKRGEVYKIQVEFLDGISMIQEYIKEGNWQGQPKPFIER